MKLECFVIQPRPANIKKDALQSWRNDRNRFSYLRQGPVQMIVSIQHDWARHRDCKLQIVRENIAGPCDWRETVQCKLTGYRVTKEGFCLMDDNLMDDNLNVGNLLETRAGRAPTTQDVEALVRSAGPRYRSSAPIAALTLAAVAVAFTIVLISKRAGKRVHVMEKY